MMNPQFAGQTKTKLQSAHISSILAPKLKDSFEIWFNQNSETAKTIVFGKVFEIIVETFTPLL